MSPSVWSEGIQRCIDAGLVEEVTIDTPGMREAVNAAADRFAKHVDAEIFRQVYGEVMEDLGHGRSR